MDMKGKGVAMENVRHCRAMGSLFRQFAVFDPKQSWKYLIEAQKWEHLADAEIASLFKECNETDFQGFRSPPDSVTPSEAWVIKQGATIPHATISHS